MCRLAKKCAKVFSFFRSCLDRDCFSTEIRELTNDICSKNREKEGNEKQTKDVVKQKHRQKGDVTRDIEVM